MREQARERSDRFGAGGSREMRERKCDVGERGGGHGSGQAHPRMPDAMPLREIDADSANGPRRKAMLHDS